MRFERESGQRIGLICIEDGAGLPGSVHLKYSHPVVTPGRAGIVTTTGDFVEYPDGERQETDAGQNAGQGAG